MSQLVAIAYQDLPTAQQVVANICLLYTSDAADE